MTKMSARSNGPALRIAVLVLAGIEIVLFAIVEFVALSQVASSNEQLGRSIGWAVAIGIAVPFVLFTLPALILGVLRRWLWVALILAVLAAVVPLVYSRLM